MENRQLRPYALQAGQGWTYNYGIDFTVKAGELGRGRRLAFVEYTTRAGEEPPDHTHGTEDEIFYVLEGDLTFRCGDDAFELPATRHHARLPDPERARRPPAGRDRPSG
jgi:quercetin dioxygenase-like cupin family protein